MKLAALTMLTVPFIVLAGTGINLMLPGALESLNNPGAHGLSEILYAWTSAANNNGSAFAGLNANTAFYNIGLAIAMWLGRFIVIVLTLALAGTLARERHVPSGKAHWTRPAICLQAPHRRCASCRCAYLPASSGIGTRS